MALTQEQVRRPTIDPEEEETARRIQAEIDDRVTWLMREGEGAIRGRLVELESEWDLERTLEANAVAFGVAGFLLGAFRRPAWYALSGVVFALLVEQALQGWSPPMQVLRRLGFRKTEEIEQERRRLQTAL